MISSMCERQRRWSGGLSVVVLPWLAACAASGPGRPARPSTPGVPAGASTPVVFDAEAAEQLIRWAQGPGDRPPPDWRSTPLQRLTRRWARISGQPDPDRALEKLLAELAAARRTNPDKRYLGDAGRLLSEVMDGRRAFLARTLPHLSGYVPPKTPLGGRVYLGVFIPAYAFSLDDSVVICLNAAFFDYDSAKVFNLLSHELYHIYFGRHQPDRPLRERPSRKDVVEHLLWQTQNEGMATYVAYRLRAPGLRIEDYRLLDDRAAVRARFEALRRLFGRAAAFEGGDDAGLRQQIWDVGVKRRAFYVVGAHMARAIEEKTGRDALVGTVPAGPRAFFAAYRATSPGDPGLEIAAPDVGS